MREAIHEITERKYNKGKYQNSESERQISVMNSCLELALKKSYTEQDDEMKIPGLAWENERGLTNQILQKLDCQKTADWQTRSWLINLLTDNFETQKHLEKAYRLGLVDANTDPYALRDALYEWKKPNR